MEEVKGMDTGIPPCKDSDCPECAKREAEAAIVEETNLAILIALVPMLVFTLINFTGLA